MTLFEQYWLWKEGATAEQIRMDRIKARNKRQQQARQKPVLPTSSRKLGVQKSIEQGLKQK